jgi:hypothetical protein
VTATPGSTRPPGRRRDERGYAALLVALFVAFLMIPLCALSIDVSRWYVEAQRVQNAADAASTAGVTFLPDDFAAAKAAAIDAAARNGYPNSGSSRVSVAVGAKPTQLVVTISSTIANTFGSAIGHGRQGITRAATADYNGPAPMGSPCNTFGNEPPGAGSGPNDPVRGPVGSVISAPPGGAVCTSNPQLWGAIAGPDTPKANGDQYSTRTCAAGNDGCAGSTNTDFDPRGYFYVIRVNPAAVNTAVTVQLYDPAFVETGNNCDVGPGKSASAPGRQNMNPFTPSDGLTRYDESTNAFCTGDVLDGGTVPIVTSYDLRQPTDTYQPTEATPITGCARQYPGYLKAAVTTQTLMDKNPNAADPTKPGNQGNPKYNADLSKVFHQWVALCTFTPSRAGDYYLQVRTDVALGGVSDGQGGFVGNANVTGQGGDDKAVHGDGNNRFAVRVKGAAAGAVSVAGWQHMSIYANYNGATSTFNLVRVIPAAATKTLVIGFFDVGDASNPGTITVLPPTDSNLSSSITGCVASGVVNGALNGCQLTNVSSGAGWNGREQFVRIPIPNTYTCDSTEAGGCWFRLQVAFPGGVQDTTTWTAQITGDPIRLIK